MSPASNEKGPRWVLRGVCPHGTEVSLFFDELGYVTDPGPDACEKHGIHPPKPTATPSRYRVWRETRRFRKTLREH